MSRKGIKIPNETKLKYAKLCFENKMSRREASRQLGGNCSCVRSWVYRYREHGELAFLDTGKNRVYSDELRLQAVLSYLQGEGSQREIAAKYGLKDATQLQRWINRRIVSYVIGDHNDTPLVFATFDQAISENRGAEPLCHSDRGFQYTTRTFHKKLEAVGMTQSMSRVAKCIDNGPMEGFWGILKRERYYGKRFGSREELVLMIENYIDYYNNERYQRRLGVLTPMEKHNSYLRSI